MTKHKSNQPSQQENPLYHDTWRLLKNYRDAVWNLELAVQQVKNGFEVEFGSCIDEFLDSIYLAGADVGGSKLEDYPHLTKVHTVLRFVFQILLRYCQSAYVQYASFQCLAESEIRTAKLRRTSSTVIWWLARQRRKAYWTYAD